MKEKEDFLEFIYQYKEDCIRYLRQKTRCSHEQAYDVFVEAILDLEEKKHQANFSEIKDMKAYLMRTSYNHWKRVFYGEIRKSKATEKVLRYFYFDLDGLETDDDTEMLLSGLQKAVMKLDLSCRNIITMFYYEQHTMTEIAQQMGYSNAYVAASTKYRCFRKLKNLTKKLIRDQ